MKESNSIYKILQLIFIKDSKLRFMMFVSMVIVYATSIGQILVPLILKEIVDRLSLPQTIDSQFSSLTIWLLFAYGISWTLFGILPAMRTRLTFGLIDSIIIKILSRYINRLVNLDYLSHSKKNTGEVIAIIERTQLALAQFIDGVFVQVLPILLQIILACLIVTREFGALYGGLLLVIIIMYILMARLSVNKAISIREKNNSDHNNFINYTMDVLHNHDAVRYFGNQEYEKKQIYDLLEIKQQSNLSMYINEGYFSALQVIVVGIGLLLITVISGHAVMKHTITIGGFILLNSYVLQFSLPLSYLGYVIQAIKKHFVDLQDFIQRMEHINDNHELLHDVVNLTNFDIKFENVSYSYRHGHNVLENISFHLPAGNKLVIIGQTGSGKSTLIKLLTGLLKPTSGRILIGGIDIENINKLQLMQLFGIIPQDCALFNRNILDNIRYGNLLTSDEEVMKLIKLLKLEHINLHDNLGERSITISGGERQRVAIARLLLKNCNICIFDEFTSALDTKTTQEITQLIDDLFINKTKIMITHNIELITAENDILILKNGQLCAFGKQSDLIVNDYLLNNTKLISES